MTTSECKPTSHERRLEAILARTGLPQGTMWVGAGLAVLGVTSYGFLVVSARALGPVRYAPLSALWALVFLAGPGFFLPFEQEVARCVASGTAADAPVVEGRPASTILRRAALLATGLVMVLFAVVAASGSALSDRIFDRDALLLMAFAASLAAYAAQFVGRGHLSGSGQFSRYGVILASEGTARFGACAGLALAGVRTAGPYGLAVGVAPALALGLAWPGRRRPRLPDVSWRQLGSAIGYLLAGSILAQILVNAAPLTVKALASSSEREIAGQFLAGLVVARVPLFLFQAVQAALLPKLSASAGAGDLRGFRAGLRRLVLVVAAAGALATLATFAVGPQAVRILFGPAFSLGRRDLVLLAAANIIFVLALVLSQALIALAHHQRVVAGWAGGIVAYAVTVVMIRGLVLRAEVALLAGCVVAAAVMGGVLMYSMRGMSPTAPVAADAVAEAAHLPLEP